MTQSINHEERIRETQFSVITDCFRQLIYALEE